ncbi:MAG: hypothetical protein GY754_00840 [bacterium]|nr:hypothetical protein [bacterium]
MKQKDIIKLYNDILENLQGDWLLVGGSLLHVLGIDNRETLDIDLVPINEVTNKDQIAIMDIAAKNGFPPETINFAAEYFVKKQENWEKELILLAENKNARMYRPSKKLFRSLKEQRGSETDLHDIQVFEENIED